MLKLKRPWGSEQAMDCTPEPVCPQPRIQFLDTPPVKKTRTALSFTSHHQQQQQQRESQFVATQSPNQEILENINHLLPKRSKRQETPTTTTTTTPFFNPFVPRDTPKEKVFTIEEVKELLDKALKEQEARLREEYDQILADRLQEQFSMFSRFNEDHISRQIQSSEYNYIS